MNKNVNLTIDETFRLAIENHQKNNLVVAQNLYSQVLEINPNHSTALSNLGVVFNTLGNIQKAKSCFEKVIEIDPNSINAHINLGLVFKTLGNIQKAKSCFEKVIEIDPNSINAHINLGVIFQDLGEHQKAISYYEKVIKIDPNHLQALNNLGVVFKELEENQKAKNYFNKVIEIDPNYLIAHKNLSAIYVRELDNFDETIDSSYKTLKINRKTSIFINQSVPLFKLKHDIQQAKYLISKDYKINGLNEFRKTGEEILSRKENEENENNFNKIILLAPNEISTLLPFHKSDHIYKPKKILESCINPNKNWLDVEDEYLNSSNQIMYIDDFLSIDALHELREFCLVSKVWNTIYRNKYLGAFSDQGFISPIHLQIAIDLKKKLPKLFGPHKIEKFWGFKYDSTLGKGINIHADFALHNLNFWITPDEFNNNKNSGGLKVYDAPAPDNWTFKDYNDKKDKIYDFLKDNNAQCTNVPYKFNRAVLFNSAYFHETDEINFKDEYEGRRINNTYLFGTRLVK